MHPDAMSSFVFYNICNLNVIKYIYGWKAVVVVVELVMMVVMGLWC